VKRAGSTRAVAVILIVVVLLPVLFYSAYEINSLSASESMVADVYRRQLDAVLFSVNLFSWDVVNGWGSELAVLFRDFSPEKPGPALASFFERHSPVSGIILADTAGRAPLYFRSSGGRDPAIEASCAALFASEAEKVERLPRYSRQNYRKIESFLLPDSAGKPGTVLLAFLFTDAGGALRLGGIRLEENRFVLEILGPRFRDVAEKEFAFAVVRQSDNTMILATGTLNPAELKQRRQLWLFPDLMAGIRLRGETIEDVARSRYERNLALILLLDAILIAGALFVYRSVRREMALVRMKSDFVSNVSHELRTPLALIRMYAETLEMGRIRGEEKKAEYYGTIVRETDRLSRLVNNLLNFSRMEAGRKPYTLVRTDVNALVASIIKSFTPHLASEGFVPVVVLGGALPSVNADAEAVQEALINLMDNAVKYSGGEKYLRVSTGRSGDEVYVAVEDHGIGISGEHQAKIFETFYRASEGLASTAKGSGLGLSIAKHIMGAHLGRIDVKSEPGKGSTFRLFFPAAGVEESGKNSRG
jgi:two-component system phosphate regulon sensor histidine kinase PhoR